MVLWISADLPTAERMLRLAKLIEVEEDADGWPIGPEFCSLLPDSNSNKARKTPRLVTILRGRNGSKPNSRAQVQSVSQNQQNAGEHVTESKQGRHFGWPSSECCSNEPTDESQGQIRSRTFIYLYLWNLYLYIVFEAESED